MSAACICKAFSEQVWKEAKALRILCDKGVADEKYLRSMSQYAVVLHLIKQVKTC